MRTTRAFREILALDPERDHARIVALDVSQEFAFDTTRALELALFRTFAVPSIAAVLMAGGEIVGRPQRRYDDTELLVRAILEHGYDSAIGAKAIARMNAIHRRFAIDREQYLYVLSTFVLAPIRWNARFGWRPMLDAERQATFSTWRAIGERMGIEAIPRTLADLEAFNVDYERAHFRRTDASVRLAEATRALFLGWMPRPLRPLGREAFPALLDPPLRRAVGLPDPSPAVTAVVTACLRAHGRALAFVPFLRRPRLLGRYRPRSYPHGFAIEALGPEEPRPDSGRS
jgi:hypothetical protein